MNQVEYDQKKKRGMVAPLPVAKMEKEMRKKMVENESERAIYTVYTLGGVTYVPHFQNDSVFVGPGYDESGIAYSAQYLIAAGAQPQEASLWRRGTSSRIKNVLGV